MKNRLFPSSLWKLSTDLKMATLYILLFTFSWISQFFQCFLPFGIFSSIAHLSGVQCPSPAVFLPVLSRIDGSIYASKTLFLYLSMTPAIFTTMWCCWLMPTLSLAVTPTSFFAELLPNLCLPILYLHSLLSVGYCNCICWTLWVFFPILLVHKYNFAFYSHMPLVSSSLIPWL